jgi:hypothetical protein
MTAHQPPVKDVVVRVALACMLADAEHGMTPAQHRWLRTRLKDLTPLTPTERERLRAPLLSWCRHMGGERLADTVQRQYTEDLST